MSKTGEKTNKQWQILNFKMGLWFLSESEFVFLISILTLSIYLFVSPNFNTLR